MRRLLPGAVAALVAATYGLAVAPPSASAGVPYKVLKCHYWHQDADEVDSAGNHNSYIAINDCNASSTDRKLGIVNRGNAGNTAYKQWMFSARSGTKFDSVCLDYKLRRDNHHRAEILSYPGFAVLASGGDAASSWTSRCFTLGGASQMIVRLACSEPGGCASSDIAHAYIRNVELRVTDTTPPSVALSGNLLGSGWLRGIQQLQSEGSDEGSGAFHLVASVNGSEVKRTTSPCQTGGLGWPYSSRLAPCPFAFVSLYAALDTSVPPFVNGANTVSVYGDDYYTTRSRITRTVYVDNLAPDLAFSNSQDSEDPELIRAPLSDAHSGVASTELSYRPVGGSEWTPLSTQIKEGEAVAHVDSSSVPGGEYEFRAEATDNVGNVATTTKREDGSPMVLTFPLRSKVVLQSHLGKGGGEHQTIPYGTPSSIAGRLLDPSGDPLANRSVRVIEHFGDGALIRTRPTQLTTDDSGRFSTKLPAGPSRQVEVKFDGSAKYLPADRVAGSLSVKSRATLRLSSKSVREGGHVRFVGRVAHFGARIPSGGKLLELQVRVQAGRWQTVKHAFRSKASGRYRLGYRFGNHYTQDARFRFRLKVEKEGEWPFRPSTSKQRSLVVEAN